MIIRIKKYFESYLLVSETDEKNNVEHQLQLACAALMVEMMFVDGSIDALEEKKIRRLVQQTFKLSDAETGELLALAHEKKHEAIDYYQFTSLINEHYTQPQKIKLVEQLWQLAYADNNIDRFEEHLVRKLAELLHVPHLDFMKSKHKALDE